VVKACVVVLYTVLASDYVTIEEALSGPAVATDWRILLRFLSDQHLQTWHRIRRINVFS
jgi:hypothetical protein